MRNRTPLDRADRELLLRIKSHRDPNWLSKLAQAIVASDPERRSFSDWLKSQGTGPPHIPMIARSLKGPDPALPRVTEFQQTEREYWFLRSLLDLMLAGHDVRELLGIKPHKIGCRGRDPLGPLIVQEVNLRVAEGDKGKKAIADVMQITGKSEASVRGFLRRSRKTKR